MTDEGAVFISVLPDSGIACHTLKREKWERDRQVGREGGRERERRGGEKLREEGREEEREEERETEKNAYKHINGNIFPLPPPTPKKKTTTKLVAMQTIRQNKHFRKRCRRQRIQKNTSCTLSSEGLGSR